MVVARPVEPNSANFDPFNCTAPIVPTKILTDPEELDRQILQNGYATALYKFMENSPETDEKQDILENGFEKLTVNDINSVELNGIENEAGEIPNNSNGCELENEAIDISSLDNECDTPDSETESYTVTLHKGEHGLGK